MFKQAKNLIAYQFTQPFTLPDELDEKIGLHAFYECPKNQLSTFGFVSPFGDCMGPLHHKVGDCVLLVAKKEEKIIPSSTVNEKLNEVATKYQAEHGRPMPKKERAAIKEDIIHEMIPVAFSRFSLTWAWVDLKSQRLIVCASSASRAEDFTALLRGAIGSLPVKPWGTEQTTEIYFTEWLQKQEAPTPFKLGDECKLVGRGDETANATLTKQDLTGEEVQQHLSHGKTCVKLGLYVDDFGSFVLDDSMHIKKLVFSDVTAEKTDDMAGAGAADLLDAEFSIVSLEVRWLLDALAEQMQ